MQCVGCCVYSALSSFTDSLIRIYSIQLVEQMHEAYRSYIHDAAECKCIEKKTIEQTHQVKSCGNTHVLPGIKTLTRLANAQAMNETKQKLLPTKQIDRLTHMHMP